METPVKARGPWYARGTFWLLIFATFLITNLLDGVFGGWLWIAAIAFLVFSANRNPGSVGKPSDLPTVEAPPAVKAEAIAAAKPENALSYFLKGRAQESKLELLLAQHQNYQIKLAEEIENFKNSVAQFPDFSSATDSEEQIFVAEGVSLVEPRKGARVTETKGRNSGRPFIGTRVGPVLIGASGGSTSRSTSVTTTAPDELTLIESDGRFIASTKGIAYVGEKFNRKADYSAIIDWTGEGFQLRISASNKSTNWIVIFDRPSDMWTAGTLLDAVDEIPARKLDTSGKATAPEIDAAIKASIEVQNEKFVEATKIAEADVVAIQSHIELLKKQYGKWM